MLKRTSVVCAVLASLAGNALPVAAATFDVNQGPPISRLMGWLLMD